MRESLFLRPSTEVFEDIKKGLTPPAGQAFWNLNYADKARRLPCFYNGNLVIKRRKPALWEILKPEMRIVHYTRLNDNRPATAIFDPERANESHEPGGGQGEWFFRRGGGVGWSLQPYVARH
jgi:hypothetical protein